MFLCPPVYTFYSGHVHQRTSPGWNGVMGFFSDQNSSPTRDWAFVPTGLYFLLPVMRINLQVLGGSGGMICSLVEPCLFGDTGIEPRSSIIWRHGNCDSSCARQRARSSTFIVSESLFPLRSHGEYYLKVLLHTVPRTKGLCREAWNLTPKSRKKKTFKK